MIAKSVTTLDLMMSDEELQSKWKQCIAVVCVAKRVCKGASYLVEVINKIIDYFKKAFDSLVEIINDVSDIFRDLLDTRNKSLPPCCRCSNYKVDTNIKINTKGFPNPILQCARSRC